MRMKRIFLIAITLLLCIGTHAQIKIDKSKPVLIMLGAEWCTSCRSMKNNVLREPMVKNLMQNYNFVYIDMDSDEAAMVVAKLREQGYKGGIPYFAIMQQDGKVTNSLNGVRTSEDFCKFLLNPNPEKNKEAV
ncbi:MAG: thioredoxin family protein [Bacteroidales bacterium]|nr:thioredoxin family protein [Bacteroidales bacterium]